MLPSIHQKEWVQLLTEAEEPTMSSYLLQSKIRSLRKRIKLKMIGLQEAIAELYADCQENLPLYQTDLFRIFNAHKVRTLR